MATVQQRGILKSGQPIVKAISKEEKPKKTSLKFVKGSKK